MSIYGSVLNSYVYLSLYSWLLSNYRSIHLFFVNSVHHLWIVSKDGRHLWINPEIVKLRLVEAFERHTIYVISELPLNSSWTRTTVDDKMWNTKHNELLPMPSMNKELTHSLLIINNTVQAVVPNTTSTA